MRPVIPFLLTFFLLSASLTAQDRFFTRNGEISFFSSTPAEDIKAYSTDASAVVDKPSGKIEFSVPMKSFTFKKALMQEHFNEDFVESDKYPKSQFKGEITDIKNIDFDTPGDYSATVKGDLSLHGETNPLETELLISVKNSKSFQLETQFEAKPADYKIDIPGSVKDNIAKVIDVKVKADFKPLER